MKRTALGMVFGVIIILLLLNRIDLNQFVTTLLNVRVPFLLVGLGLKVFVMWIKSYRWALTIQFATGNPVRYAFNACMIGFAGNVLLPIRLGELARVMVIDKHNRLGRSLALTTIGITQLFDMLFLVIYFLIISIFTTNLFTAKYLPIGVLGFFILFVFIGLAILKKKYQLLSNFFQSIRKKLPKVFDRHISYYSNQFIKGLDVLAKSKNISYVFMLTLFIWGFETFAMYLMLLAFHIQPTLLMAAMLLIVLNMSFAFPIVPGNIGIHQAVSILLLGTFGIMETAAFAYSVGAQSATFVIIVSMGLWFLYQENMSLKLIRSSAQEDSFENSETIKNIQ